MVSKTKYCTKCEKIKPLNEFYDFIDQKTGELYYQSRCKICTCVESRASRLQRYGITLTQYNQMLEDQDDVCKICGKTETKRNNPDKTQSLSVDHNYKTGKIRGLLCAQCNRALGGFKDDPELLRKALTYLEDNHEK